MPTQEVTITPYNNLQDMHANYVIDSERTLAFEHAHASAELLFSTGLAADDVLASGECVNLNLDEEAEIAASQHAKLTAQQSRYGNAYMGARASKVPEHPEIAGYEYFRQLYKGFNSQGKPDDKKTDWRKVLKMRKWLPFAKCDTCSTHRTAMATTKDPKSRCLLIEAQTAHLDHCRRERTSYMLRQKLATAFPDRFLSLIFDGADCSKTEIPQMAYRSHASSAVQKVKMHVMGCIAHSHQSYLFTCPPHIAQGHNVTIQALYEVLVHHKQVHGRIPPTLNIQLDNTTKQNKGKYLMGYLGTLIKDGVIKQAFVNFLPVGHTHEDIDQLFSRVSTYLRRFDAPDDVTLRACLRASFRKYGKPPIVVGWDKVANISGYLQKLMVPDASTDITLYHQISITMAATGSHAGQVVLQARTWPGSPWDDKSDFWRGLQPDTHSVLLFNRLPDLLRDYLLIPPQAQPEHIGSMGGKDFKSKRKNFAESMAKTRDGVERLAGLFPTLFTATVKENWDRMYDLLVSNLDADNPVTFHWSLVHTYTSITNAHNHRYLHVICTDTPTRTHP